MSQPDSGAPHGRDSNGVPLAPYGLNVDGSPRKSNRGARAGARKGTGPASKRNTIPTVTGSNLSDEDRKGMLCELGDMFVVGPLASLSQVPFIAKYIGTRQTNALAGDAFILSQYFPGIADGAILLSKTKPRTLAWLDKLETNAPYLVLANAISRAAKALAENHFNPNPSLAQAGRSLAALRMAEMAAAVIAQEAVMRGKGESEMNPEQFERAAYDRARETDPTVQFATA